MSLGQSFSFLIFVISYINLKDLVRKPTRFAERFLSDLVGFVYTY